VRGQTFVAPLPYKLANTVNAALRGTAYRRRLEGYYGQAEFDLYEQLFVTARLRVDGASTFGTENQRAWYPGGQVAWVFTRMFWAARAHPDDSASCALAYGESGQEPAVYLLQDVMNTGGITDFFPGTNQVPTLRLRRSVDGQRPWQPAIKPERVSELDAGIDLVLFNGRADIGVTYYHQNSSDVIFSVAVPPSTGATSQNLNAAEIAEPRLGDGHQHPAHPDARHQPEPGPELGPQPQRGHEPR
jgi:hypothetical protein